MNSITLLRLIGFIWDIGDNLVIDDYNVYVNEDSEQGMAIIVSCPANCSATGFSL